MTAESSTKYPQLATSANSNPESTPTTTQIQERIQSEAQVTPSGDSIVTKPGVTPVKTSEKTGRGSCESTYNVHRQASSDVGLLPEKPTHVQQEFPPLLSPPQNEADLADNSKITAKSFAQVASQGSALSTDGPFDAQNPGFPTLNQTTVDSQPSEYNQQHSSRPQSPKTTARTPTPSAKQDSNSRSEMSSFVSTAPISILTVSGISYTV